MIRINIPNELIYVGLALGAKHCVNKKIINTKITSDIVVRIINGYIDRNIK